MILYFEIEGESNKVRESIKENELCFSQNISYQITELSY